MTTDPRATGSLYDVLGVLPCADAKEIRSAYRQRALLVHPDKAGGSKEAFQETVRAFEKLSCERFRAVYDAKRLVPAASKRRRSSPASSTQGATAGSGARQDDDGATSASLRLEMRLHSKLRGFQQTLAILIPQTRRQVLATTAERVRNALLIFMQSEVGCGQGVAARGETGHVRSHGAHSTMLVHNDGGPSLSEHASSECEQSASASDDSLPILPLTYDCEQAGVSTATLEEQGIHHIPDGASRASHCTGRRFISGTESRTTRPSSSKAGMRGVRTSPAGKYSASIFFLNLSLVTPSVRSLEVALGFHAMLVYVKQMVSEHAGTVRDLEPCIREAINRACVEFKVLRTEFAVVFRAQVYVSNMLGRKHQVTGPFTQDLHLVLEQRARLCDAKLAGWAVFRDAWIELMQVPAPRETYTRSPKTLEEAIATADAALEAGRAFREQRACRRARREAHCIGRLQSALDRLERQGEHRAAFAHRKRVEARWRWARGSQLTMEEILRGPPM